jgi:hypothetical protein
MWGGQTCGRRPRRYAHPTPQGVFGTFPKFPKVYDIRDIDDNNNKLDDNDNDKYI